MLQNPFKLVLFIQAIPNPIAMTVVPKGYALFPFV